MSVSPVGDRRKATRYIRKECGEFRESGKNAKANVIISITHTVKTRIRESIRKRRAVKVKK